MGIDKKNILKLIEITGGLFEYDHDISISNVECIGLVLHVHIDFIGFIGFCFGMWNRAFNEKTCLT